MAGRANWRVHRIRNSVKKERIGYLHRIPDGGVGALCGPLQSWLRGSQMSRKGGPIACKSKQIPRIFRSRRGSCSGRGWTHGEAGGVGETTDYTHSSLLFVSPDGDKREEANKKEKQKTRNNEESVDYHGREWSVGNQVINGGVEQNVQDIEKTADVETVANIEKWLKTRTESVSSMDLDVIKSEVEEGVDRYLGEELPHAFLGKDPDVLSIDIDLSDKKLSLGYDPIFQSCEKDEFILPEFQLDHLDPLSLSPDDMMVAGEILPSTSGQPGLTIPNGDVETPETECERQETIESQDPCSKSTEVTARGLQPGLDIKYEVADDHCQSESNVDSSENSVSLYVEALASGNDSASIPCVTSEFSPEASLIQRLKTKAKVKLEPRIIKKRRKISERLGKQDKHRNGSSFADSQDGVMAVVAISTDKISNMTQIVINTGTEEQIYQGKTSELIEATGNFPKLPQIDTTTAWNGTIEYNVDSSSNNQHEMLISNALEELGITDDNLQPVSVTEHGKVWLCPRNDCNRQFSRLYALKGHLLAHYGVRPFKCDFEGCTWAFYSEFKLKRHKDTHLKRKDFVCEVEGCNRRFTTIYNLWSHEKLHTRPNRVVCQVPDCREKFQTKRALELHMKSHDQSHAPYVCKHEGCGKRYYSSNALTSHQRCHNYKEIDIKCSWPGCTKVFDKPCRLKAHIRSHTGCKPYICTFQGCQWAFSSSSKLKRHQKKHTNERKFVCEVPSCGKAFMRSEHLKEHRLTHKEGRYFQCYICDARFSAKSSLYVHMKKHQTKGNVQTRSRGTSNCQKRIRSKESQCSRVNPVVKLKRKPVEPSTEIIYENSPVAEPPQIVKAKVENDVDEDVDVKAFQEDQVETVYHCPMETCTRSYTTKATLRAHMLKVHGTPIGDDDKTLKRVSPESVSNMDYILYTTPSSTTESTEQMIMVAPCDAVILSTSPETDRCLPEPEPPPLNTVIKSSEVPHSVIHPQTPDQHVKKDQGSARTGLTCTDVWKLKENNALLESVVETSDVVLGTDDIGEGLFLTEELPSMYYQDEVVGTEYQVLLLDSGPSESTISLRGLE